MDTSPKLEQKIAAIYRQVVGEAGPDGIDFELAISISTDRLMDALSDDEKAELAFAGIKEIFDEEWRARGLNVTPLHGLRSTEVI